METQEKESSTVPPSLEAAAARACPVLRAQAALLEAGSFKLSFRVTEQPCLTLPHADTLLPVFLLVSTRPASSSSRSQSHVLS